MVAESMCPFAFGDRLQKESGKSVRIRANVLKDLWLELFKKPDSFIIEELKDERIAGFLIQMFIDAADCHQTVKDIIAHHTDELASTAADLQKVFIDHFIGRIELYPLERKLRIITDLQRCRRLFTCMILEPSSRLSFMMQKDFSEIVSNVTTCNAEWKEASRQNYEKLLEEQLSLLMFVSDQTPASFRQNEESVHASVLLLLAMDFLDFPLRSKAAVFLHRITDSKSEPYSLFLDIHSENSDYSFETKDTLFSAALEGISNSEFCQSFTELHRIINMSSSESNKDYLFSLFCRKLIQNLPVLLETSVESRYHAENIIEMCWRRFIWTKSFIYALEFLRGLVCHWSRFSEVQSEILESLVRFPWLSELKQRCWVLLIPLCGLDRFFQLEKVAPIDLLRIIPKKAFRHDLSALLILIASPDNILEVLKESRDHHQFLAKNVLPVVGRKPGFLVEIMKKAVGESCFDAYGPILSAVRSCPQVVTDVVKKEMLAKYLIPQMEVLMCYENETTRLEVFNLVCESGDLVDHFPVFSSFLLANMNEQFLKFRQPMLRSVAAYLKRLKLAAKRVVTDLYRDELITFLETILRMINPSSAYARRSMALQLILSIFTDFGVNISAHNPSFSLEVCRIVLEAMMWETFPDNQSLCVKVLQIPSVNGHIENTGINVVSLLELADREARDVAADDAGLSVCIDRLIRRGRSSAPDTLNYLLGELKRDLNSASTKGMLWSAAHAPIYGQVFRIRSFLQVESSPLQFEDDSTTKRTVAELFALMSAVSKEVEKAVSCFSDGLSMDTYNVAASNDTSGVDHYSVDDEADSAVPSGKRETSATGQMLFVCCWRCIREVSILYTEMCTGIALRSYVSSDGRSSAFNWLVEQLLITPHSGTFESIAEQIGRFAVYLESIGESNVIRSLLEILIKKLENWESPLKAGNTRRGAGIPRLTAILLSSLRKEDGITELLDRILGTHFRMAEAADLESRIRSFFVIDAVLHENAMHELTEKFVSKVFILSISNMASPEWSVRNATACLFAGLMQRTFGPAVKKEVEHLEWRESCLPAANFFRDHIEVYDYILEELGKTDLQQQKGTLDRRASILMAIFGLLSRLYSAPEDPKLIGRLRGVIMTYLDNRNVRVREVVARAVVGLHQHDPKKLEQLLIDSFSFSASESSPETSPHRIDGLILVLSELDRVWSFLYSTERSSSKLNEFIGEIFNGQFAGLKLLERKISVLQLMNSFGYFEKSAGDFMIKELFSADYNSDPFYPKYVNEIVSYLTKMDPEHMSLFGRQILKSPVLPNVFPAVFEAFLVALTDSMDVYPSLELRSVTRMDISSNGQVKIFRNMLRRSDRYPIEELETLLDWMLEYRHEHSFEIADGSFEVTAILVEKIQLEKRTLEERTIRKLVTSIRETLSGNPDIETRRKIAEFFPTDLRFRSELIQPSTEILLWTTFIQLLRDDEESVRKACAKRLHTAGLVSFIPSPSKALSVVLSHLIEVFAEKKQIVQLICSLCSFVINDDDRMRAGSEAAGGESAVFSDCDRHEYHENVFLLEISDRFWSGRSGNLEQLVYNPSKGFAGEIVERCLEAAECLKSGAFLEQPDLCATISNEFFLYCCSLRLLTPFDERLGVNAVAVSERVESALQLESCCFNAVIRKGVSLISPA